MHVERTIDDTSFRVVFRQGTFQVAPGPRPIPTILSQALPELVELWAADDLVVATVCASHQLSNAANAMVGLLGECDIAALIGPPDWHAADRQRLSGLVRRVVEESAGPLTTAHGGAIHVESVLGQRVQLRFSGACRGCQSADDTLANVIVSALFALRPGLDVLKE